MDESERRPQYRESATTRARLEAMNALLASAETRLESEATAAAAPLLFVIGAPRSGTTLTAQLLAHAGLCAWANNFVARFWRTPAVGFRIARALGFDGTGYQSTFRSEYGVTEGWLEPHEFGYFWDRFFDLGQSTHKLDPDTLLQVDSAGLARAVDALQAEVGGALMFKNNTWCTLQASFLARVFPRARFVACLRAPIYLAQSLLLARRERLVQPDAWWSVRPSNYERIRELPVLEQVAQQASTLQRELDAELAQVPSARVVRVDYSRLCAEPARVLVEIADCAALPLAGTSGIPASFASTDRIRIGGDEWSRLEAAVARA